MRKDRQRRSPFEEARLRAQELLNSVPAGMSAAEIARRLAGEIEDPPGERTVRNWIASGRIRIESGFAPWTVNHAERPEDIPLVLEVMEAHRHPTWWLTAEQGRWVARLRRAFPAMNHVTVLDLARKAVTMDELAFTKLLLTGERPAY